MSATGDDLLPGFSGPFERAQADTSARLLDTDTDAIRRQRDPARCDAAFLPLLAAERSVHFRGGSLAQRRARIAASFDDHLAYGTPTALEREIALDTGEAPADIRIREFWQERGLQFPDFVVEALRDPGDPSPDLRPHLASAIRRKNVRDWPKTRVHWRHPPGALRHGAGAWFAITIRTVDRDRRNLVHGAAMRLLLKQRARAW